MLDLESVRKVRGILASAGRAENGPVRFSLLHENGAWSVCFSGAITGQMHPFSFCELMVKMLNEEQGLEDGSKD